MAHYEGVDANTPNISAVTLHLEVETTSSRETQAIHVCQTKFSLPPGRLRQESHPPTRVGQYNFWEQLCPAITRDTTYIHPTVCGMREHLSRYGATHKTELTPS